MTIKKSRLRKIKRLLSVLLLLAMFLGTGLLPPTFAYVTADNSIVKRLPDAKNLLEQGSKFYEAERFAEAATSWQQAISALQGNGDEQRLAIALGNLSLAYQQLGQWSEAEGAIAQSLNLLQTAKDIKDSSQILAQVLDIKGRLQLAQNKAEDALDTWRLSVDIYAKIGDKRAVIQNRINQAQALQALGFYRQAEKTLRESTQILQSQPNSPVKVAALHSLGNVVQVTGDLETSRQILEQSLKLASSLQDKEAIADILLSLGNTARVQQDTQTAIKYYQQTIKTATSPTTRIQAQANQLRLLLKTEQLSAFQTLSSQIKTQLNDLPLSRTTISTRINFAQSLMQFRKKTAADTDSWLDIAQLLATAIEQAKSLQDKRTQSYAIGVLGQVYEQTQQWSDAQNLTQQALLIAQAIDAKDIGYQWQWQLGRLLKTKGDIKGAVAAYTEAVNNLQALRSDLVAVNSAVKFSFREEVEPVYRQLVDLLLQSQGNSQVSSENLAKASNTIESLQIAELENFFRNNCLNAQIRNPKKDPKAAIIYPFILLDRLEVIVELPQQRWLHYTTPVVEEEVETTLRQLQENLPKPHTLRQVQSLSQKVYKWLIQPAEAALAETKTPTLVFVLDGWLRNIPMAALYDGKQYLVEKYNIALTPSLQLIEPKPLEKGLKAIAAGLSEASSGFSALPNVKLELEQIRSQVPSSILLNQEFTSKTLQSLINSLSFPIVHLATHGQFSSKAEETFIVAWNERIYVKKLNELVRTLEQNRPEAIELLILSACQTAAGDEQAALGIAGVAFQAGARSTIASLWNLDDESTAVLMNQFYQELGNKNLTKAEVLRRAQLALLQNPKYKRPRFWAPYVLLGNWL